MQTDKNAARPQQSAVPPRVPFRDIYLVASAPVQEDTAIDGTITELSGWISCFEQAPLAGGKGICLNRMGASKEAQQMIVCTLKKNQFRCLDGIGSFGLSHTLLEYFQNFIGSEYLVTTRHH